MIVQVWHVRAEHFRAALCGEPVAFSPDNYQQVAVLEPWGERSACVEAAYDEAFQATNSFDADWTQQRVSGEWIVTPLLLRCRSTSVGDVVVVDGRAMRCAGIGWTPLAETEEGR